jgi:hypothetical protein
MAAGGVPTNMQKEQVRAPDSLQITFAQAQIVSLNL